MVDFCKYVSKHRVVVNKLSDCQLLEEVTVLIVSIHFFVHFCEAKSIFILRDLWF